MKKEISRIIYIDSIEELDLQNVGVHFTTSPSYRHSGGGSNGCTVVKKYIARITINGIYATKKINYNILEDATKESNDNFPHEKEVVLAPNQKMKATLQILDQNGSFHFFGFRGIEVDINIGNRMDQWVQGYL